MRSKIIVVLSFVLIYCIQSGICASSVRAVAMIIRHGHRTPVGTYPNNLVDNSTWSCGFGNLTPKGILEIYKSGLHKSKFYYNLDRSPETVYARSSTLTRCRISAQSFLDAFISKRISEIKVHVAKTDESDEMLAIPGRACAKYEPEVELTLSLKQPKVMAITGGFEFVEYVENYAGQPIGNLYDFFVIADNILVQLENGIPMPKWAEPVYNEYLKPLYELYHEVMFQSEKMQIKSGVLLNDIIWRFDGFVNGSRKNVLFYSAHDFTMTSLMYILDIGDQIVDIPSYGAVFALELHRNRRIRNDYEIKIIYFKDYADEFPTELSIPHCTKPCTFSAFKKLYSPLFIADYDRICYNNAKPIKLNE